MPQMTIDEAFTLLEAPLDADALQLKEIFHEKSKLHHPDKSKGNHEFQAKLNEAYEIASAYSKVRYSLIRIDSNELLEAFNKALKAQPSFSAELTAQRIKKKKTRPLQRMKFILWGIGGVTGLIAIFGNDFPLYRLLSQFLFLLPGSPKMDMKVFEGFMKPLTFLFGFMGLVLQLIVSYIGNRIDVFTETISDRRTAASALAKHLRFEDTESFTDTDLAPYSYRSGALPQPIDRLLDVSIEFSQILLKKALEHSLIELIEQDTLSPDSIDKYRLRFKPSLFKPPPAPAPEFTPLTRKEAKATIIGGLVWSLLLGGGTIYLAITLSSYWSILTGIIALPGLGAIILGAVHLRVRPVLVK